jgi:hypothetical protein
MEPIKKELELIQQIKQDNLIKYTRKKNLHKRNDITIYKRKLSKDGSTTLPKSKPLY